MKALLDTHVFLWMISGDKRLSKKAEETILDQETELWFSAASYWEICIKLSIGKLKMQSNWTDVFEREMRLNGVRWLPLKPEHAQGVIKLPWHHRDPFDRILVSQCMNEGLTCITADSYMALYDIPCLW
jgi:PIN domain nuclease of toxin-antitoxin system